MTTKPKLWTRDFIFLALANLLMAISFYFMLPILPVYLVDKLGATKGEIGVILAFYTIAALVIRLFAGWALDAYSRKAIYLSAYVLFSLIFIGYPVAFTVFQFIIIRFLHGLTWGTLTTSGSTISVDLIPPSRRGEGIGFFGLSMTIGMALGPMIAILITGESDYYRLFISAIIITFLGLILAQTVKIPSIKSHVPARTLNLKGLIEKSAIPISINMLLVMFTYGGVISFISLYGKEIGINNSGPFFLILSLGIGLSRIGSGKIFDKNGPQKITIMGMIFLIIGFPLLAFFDNPLGFHLSAVVLGLGFGVIMPTYQAMINNLVSPNRRGAANSTFFTAFDLGIGFGMVGTGILSDKLGFSTTFLISSVIIFLALLFFLFISFNHYKTLLRRNDSIE